MTDTPVPRMLLAKEVAPLLHVPLARVYALAKTGELPTVRIGRYLRFPEDELRAWIRRGGTNGQHPGSTK